MKFSPVMVLILCLMAVLLIPTSDAAYDNNNISAPETAYYNADGNDTMHITAFPTFEAAYNDSNAPTPEAAARNNMTEYEYLWSMFVPRIEVYHECCVFEYRIQLPPPGTVFSAQCEEEVAQLEHCYEAPKELFFAPDNMSHCNSIMKLCKPSDTD